ncbi:MAG: hypothetical protein M3135_07890 [Actinomycetota bacterium]|nr:hypothetical protein [Actinomycetota bacterium]
MPVRPRSFLVVALLSGALLVPAGGSNIAAAEEGTHSPNMSHVTTLAYGKPRPSAMENGGTDIEFASLKVDKRDANDKRICKPQRDDPDRCRRNKKGNIIYQKEFREFALAGSYDNGLQIVDITTPTASRIVGHYDCAIRQGDVQVFARGKRTYATYTQDDPYNGDPPHDTSSDCYREAGALGLYKDGETNPAGTFIVDITNPRDPVTASFFSEPRGSHNQTVAPGGNFVYNSNSDLGTKNPQIEVWSIEDFSNPRPVFTLNTQSGLSSHDITFSEDGTRAYSAAVTHTLVLDTTDLAQPKIIGRIIDPAINIHHQSDPITMDGQTFLIITDELAGAAGNAVCPGGGLHVYDITGPLERNPRKVGFWNSPGLRPAADNITCTSHVLRLYPEQKLMTIAWYEAGVRVVDISGLTGVSVGFNEEVGNVGMGMREIGYHYFENSDTWSAKTNRIEADGSFYLYGNDLARGLDIYRFDGTAERSANPGRWMTPEEALAQARAGGVQTDVQTGPYCLYRGMRVA